MSPRPRKASDEDVFAAASRVMSRLGPSQLTLAAIAGEAGLTAGALVQRFGSRRGLLLALTARAAASTAEFFARLRAEHRSPLAALRAYGDCFAGMAESPAALARHLSYLQNDLTDPEFHRHTMAQARVTRGALRDLIGAAQTAGELSAKTPVNELARTVEVTIGGSLMTWAFFREADAAAWLRRDLNAVLRPYLAAGARPRRGHSRR